MIQPLLSILIPTVVDRESQLDNLTIKLIGSAFPKQEMFTGQFGWIWYDGQVQILIIKDDKKITIGEKRDTLYRCAQGEYSIQVDDDDELSDNAIGLILNAIKSNPGVDCVTFEEHIDIDGKIEKSNHSLTYGDWEGEGGKELWDGFHYHRTPFFKSVIKTEIARSVPIPNIRFGEDHQWAQALKPHLKTEIHIPEQIYKYIHISSPHNLRYGFDK